MFYICGIYCSALLYDTCGFLGRLWRDGNASISADSDRAPVARGVYESSSRTSCKPSDAQAVTRARRRLPCTLNEPHALEISRRSSSSGGGVADRA